MSRRTSVKKRTAAPRGQRTLRLWDAINANTERLDAIARRLDALAVPAAAPVPAQPPPHAPASPAESAPAVSDAAAAYRQTVRRIRRMVQAVVPVDTHVVIVGKVDRQLAQLGGRKTSNFPQAADGTYAGFYPACSTSAIAHLESVRARGGEYLLIPEPARWWLEHYTAFRRHLEQRYRLLTDQPRAGLVFSLRECAHDVWRDLDQLFDRFESREGRAPSVLDWHTGLRLSDRYPRCAIFTPPDDSPSLPYLDGTVDFVAVGDVDAVRAAEAGRVALAALLTFASRDGVAPAVSIKPVAGAVDHNTPSVSIIVPCFNGRALTEACLSALFETLPRDVQAEVIAIDDASTDDTAAFLAARAAAEPRLRVIRQRRNGGFVKSCNRAAKAARGEILVFLNNDTIPLPGWLDPLMRVLRERAKAGAVGGRLVWPDGRLHEAGGVVFCDASAANFGRGDYDADAPQYLALRRVDYCSAALLATPRALFLERGGFDPIFAPGYYEDVDYCFKLRRDGYEVFVEPESTVVHVEGGTAGLDVSAGMKRYQVVNHAKFLERWGEALRAQPARPERFDFPALHRLAVHNGAVR